MIFIIKLSCIIVLFSSFDEVIGLFEKFKIRATNTVAFCTSNVFRNKNPFVLVISITVTKNIGR